MSLEREIELIDNPQRFTQLCTSLLNAEYKTDYQPVDDNRSDDGNDGYLITEQRMFARHCFKKPPQRRTDGDIFNKLKSDFKKAVKLRDAGRYDIKKWTFLTNYNLSNNLLVQAKKLGEGANIDVTHLGPAFLTGLLLKHRNLLSEFPELQQLFVIEEVQKGFTKMSEQIEGLAGVSSSRSPASSAVNEDEIGIEQAPLPKTPQIMSDKDLKEALKLTNKGTTSQNKTRLTTIAYSSPSNSAQIQAVMTLSNWFDLRYDDTDDMLSLCDIAITAANVEQDKSSVAVLLADKARYLTHKLVAEEVDLWHKQQVNNLYGLVLIAPEEIDRQKQRTLVLDEQRRNVAIQAIDVATEANNLRSYAFVLLYIGESAGALAEILDRLGDRTTSRAQLQLCKKLLMQAKTCFETLNEPHAAIYVVHNLANQLRVFDRDVALRLTEQNIEKAKQLKDADLEVKASLLLKRIKKG